MSQHRFRSEKYNVFTEEIKNDDKRIQLIDSVEAYVYGTSKDLVCMRKLNVAI